MKRVIFVVHSSEIVRCGLTLILRKYFNIEITQLSSVNELSSYTHTSNSIIILCVEAQPLVQEKLFLKLKNNNGVYFIGIDGDTEQEQNFVADYRIDFLVSGLKIQSIVSEILNTSKHQTVELAESSDLTTREKDVLKLVALGHSNKEIADQLFISIHTVISHRKNLTEKLGIKSSSGLTDYAILNQLIDTDSINPEDLI